MMHQIGRIREHLGVILATSGGVTDTDAHGVDPCNRPHHLLNVLRKTIHISERSTSVVVFSS